MFCCIMGVCVFLKSVGAVGYFKTEYVREYREVDNTVTYLTGNRVIATIFGSVIR